MVFTKKLLNAVCLKISPDDVYYSGSVNVTYIAGTLIIQRMVTRKKLCTMSVQNDFLFGGYHLAFG